MTIACQKIPNRGEPLMNALHLLSNIERNLADGSCCLLITVVVAASTLWICFAMMFVGAFS